MEQITAIAFKNIRTELNKVDNEKAVGLITKEEAAKLKKRLRDKWYRLEKKVGRKVNPVEVDNMIYEEYVVPSEVEVKQDPAKNLGEAIVEQLQLANQICKLPENLKSKAMKAITEKLNTTVFKFHIVPKKEEILKELPGKSTYVILDLTLGQEKFEIANEDFSVVSKNKSCGSWKRIAESKETLVYKM